MAEPAVTETGTVATTGVGHPDYAAPVGLGNIPVGPIYTMGDLGELAVRLGSIVSFDRRGSVVWLDDFEDNLGKWIASGGGTGNSQALSTDTARGGAKSAKLVTGSDAAGNYALLSRWFSLPKSYSRMGLEFHYSINDSNWYLVLGFTIYESDYYYRARVRVYQTGEIQIEDSTGTFQTVGTLTMPFGSITLFNALKLVVDVSERKYERLLFNQEEYDISTYSLYRLPTLGAYYAIVAIGCYTSEAVGKTFYVDDFILTQNEPPND